MQDGIMPETAAHVIPLLPGHSLELGDLLLAPLLLHTSTCSGKARKLVDHTWPEKPLHDDECWMNADYSIVRSKKGMLCNLALNRWHAASA